MFPNKVTKPLFDKINIRGHGFSKTKLLIKKNETHFNSEQPLKEEKLKVIFRLTILLFKITT